MRWLLLDAEAAQHVQAALLHYRRRLRQNYHWPPPDIDALERALAQPSGTAAGRPGPPPVDPSGGGTDGGPDRLLVTVEEAARMLAVSQRTVERLLADDRLPSVTIGRARRIHRDDLDAFLDRHRNGAADG